MGDSDQPDLSGQTVTGFRDLHQQLGKDRILEVVASFYELIRVHPTLGNYFSEVKNWPMLKQRIGHFWWIDLGGERFREDVYNPHAVHRHLQIPPALVDDWLQLFESNLTAQLPTDQAQAWLGRATKMAEWIRIDLHQQGQQTS